MNICILASIGSQNLGDELILKNEIQLLEQEFGENIHFKIATYDTENIFYTQNNTEYFEYFPINIKKNRNILRNIKNLGIFLKNIIWSDIAVIGGGGIIYDDEVQSVGNPLNQWIFRANIARLFRKKLYFYAIGVDIKNQENSKKLKNIFKNAYKITVRDEKSQKQLQNIGIKSDLVDDPVMHDAIFYENTVASFPNVRERIQDRVTGDDAGIISILSSKTFHISDLENYDFKGKKVGLALRSGYFDDASAASFLLKRENGMSSHIREKKLIQELCNFIEQSGGTIIFLPHSFHETDELANDYIFLKQFVTERRKIKTNMQEVYNAYTSRETDINITMRLHSIILSHVYDISQIVLSYSTKTDEVIKKLKK